VKRLRRRAAGAARVFRGRGVPAAPALSRGTRHG